MVNTIDDRLHPMWDSGGTSLKAVYLAAAIQEEFGVAVDAIEIIEQGVVGKDHRTDRDAPLRLGRHRTRTTSRPTTVTT